jgi:hypothetical protein
MQKLIKGILLEIKKPRLQQFMKTTSLGPVILMRSPRWMRNCGHRKKGTAEPTPALA